VRPGSPFFPRNDSCPVQFNPPGILRFKPWFPYSHSPDLVLPLVLTVETRFSSIPPFQWQCLVFPWLPEGSVFFFPQFRHMPARPLFPPGGLVKFFVSTKPPFFPRPSFFVTTRVFFFWLTFVLPLCGAAPPQKFCPCLLPIFTPRRGRADLPFICSAPPTPACPVDTPLGIFRAGGG